ncbi:MAG: hypothetical protein IJ565_03920 [Bacilli bacterium]|nr:hypothetical protein [Bacilli bacterium]
MIGQIRSYISYITIDSDNNYLNRIKNMIESVEDNKVKYDLIIEYNKKISEINTIKSFQANHNSKPQELKPVLKATKKVIKKRRLPYIYTSAEKLLKIYSMSPRINKEIAIKDRKEKIIKMDNNYGLPIYPIYDDNKVA